MLFFSIFLFSSVYLFFDYLFFYFFIFLLLYFCLVSHSGFFDGAIVFDTFSLFLLFMSIWIFSLSVFSMSMDLMAFFLFVFMFFFILVSFSISNFLMFYFSFEFVFIFMFFFLLGWGPSMERLQATFYMFFYTMVFSLPFLLMLVDIFLNFSDFFLLLSFFSYSNIFLFFMFLVFMVKLPIFGLHLWLPKAHVEAPVSGSMLLAGVLLKLGGYGIFRFIVSTYSYSFSTSFFFNFIFYTSLVGSVLTSLICLRQMDLKILIAYSSVVHMSVMLLGLLSGSFFGILGSLLMMVSHGFISPLMFFLMSIKYDLYHSRSIMVLKGASLVSPIFCFFWFSCCFLNLSVPPFMSFFSEVFILGSLSFLGPFEWVFIFFVCFFTGLYCTFSYVVLAHGGYTSYFSFLFSSKLSMISSLHIFFLFSYPFFFFVY